VLFYPNKQVDFGYLLMLNYLKVNLCFIFFVLLLNEILILALTPIEYLEKYCRVNNRRHTLYKRVFDKYKDNEGVIHVKVKIE